LFEVYDSPVYGFHDPLVLGWSDDQLRPIVKRLRPRLPTGLTANMLLAAAGCALSLAVEKKSSGKRLRYARAKEPYRAPKRYRSGHRFDTWHYLTTAMDVLEGAGLIDQAVGVRGPRGRGYQSVARATDELVQLLAPIVELGAETAQPIRTETIILRDRKDKKQIDYPDTAETETMRDQVQFINEHLKRLHLIHEGKRFDIPVGRRVFNGDFTRGGRFYCQGTSFQNIESYLRGSLESVIDGVAHPVVEIDYSSLHPTMAYTEARTRMPPGDPYGITGYDRRLVKVAVNALLNAPTQSSATKAIREELRTNEGLRAASGLEVRTRRECMSLAEKVVGAIKAKHWRIKAYFGSDCGARFQRQDSDMAVEVMIRMIAGPPRDKRPRHGRRCGRSVRSGGVGGGLHCSA